MADHPVRILTTQKSEADILGIITYYHSHGASSQWFRDAVAAAIRHLEQYPETAVRRRDLTRRDVLFWLINPYWLILKRTDDALFIVSVMHCSRKLGTVIRERLKDFHE